MRNRTDLNARFFVAPDGTVYPKARGISEKLRREISVRDNWLCRYCGTRVANPGGGEWWIMRAYRLQDAHIDHVLPIRRGGRSDPSNLVLACVTCNIHKREADNREAVRCGVRSLPPKRAIGSMHKGDQ